MKKKLIPENERSKIIELLKSKVSICEIRNQTGYGVNILKRILKESALPYQTYVRKDVTYNTSLNIFIKNSTSTNTSINILIKRHNIIPFDKCWHCGLSEWINGPLSLELDHINGVGNDHRIENLRYLCPNCHSQTPTYKNKNIQRNNKVSDEVLLKALQDETSIRRALIKVGLSGKGGNYKRVYNLKYGTDRGIRTHT